MYLCIVFNTEIINVLMHRLHLFISQFQGRKKKKVLYCSTKKDVLIPKDPIKIIGPFISVGFHTYKRNANPWENVLSSFNNICFLRYENFSFCIITSLLTRHTYISRK